MTTNLLAIFILSIIAFIAGIFSKSKQLKMVGFIMLLLSVLGFAGLVYLIGCM